MIKTVLFDFDDTVCNTTECVEKALDHCYSQLSEQFPHITREEFIKADIDAFRELFYQERVPVYRASILIWFRIFKKLNLNENEVLIYKMYKYLYQNVTKHIKLNNGFDELVKYAKMNGIKMGILSNGAFLEKMERYEKLGLKKYEIKLITSNLSDFKNQIQEHLDIFWNFLAVKQNETMFIGDTLSADIEGAKKCENFTSTI